MKKKFVEVEGTIKVKIKKKFVAFLCGGTLLPARDVVLIVVVMALVKYACYETLSLTTYNTGNGKFDELSQKKNAAICDVSITLYKQKRENFIPPFRRCWLPLFLLQ